MLSYLQMPHSTYSLSHFILTDRGICGLWGKFDLLYADEKIAVDSGRRYNRVSCYHSAKDWITER